MNWLRFLWEPVAGWFSDNRRADALRVLNIAQQFIAYALPIVEEIDKVLKPNIKLAMSGECQTPIACLISDFLSKYGLDSEVAKSYGLNLQGMPIADLCVNVALLILRHVAPEIAASSILRLSIELAYNVYKASAKKDEVADALV